LRYFKQGEAKTAENIQAVLKEQGFNYTLVYISGYENSNLIKPMHFELWLAAGS